jgi:hypothetical protein
LGLVFGDGFRHVPDNRLSALWPPRLFRDSPGGKIGWECLMKG